MKNFLGLILILLLFSLVACKGDVHMGEIADISGIVFEDESATPAVLGGYPRFELLKDGTLMLFCDGTVRKSTDNGATWKKNDIYANAATEAVSSSGKTHALSLENWQGFTMADGTVMLAYRARTKGYTSGEFYTSIRVMISTDNAETFNNEVIIAEATTDSFHGYWEPFMIQPTVDEVLLFYSDDLNVNSSGQQNIVYHSYNVINKTWGDSTIAINGIKRNSRDGMPVITELSDGGYAMVIETNDYNRRIYKGVWGRSVFVIGLSLSKDGKSWSEPVPVVAPENIRGGDRAAAPYITTLPDGRVIISYMTEDGFSGTRVSDEVLNCVYGAVISNEVITTDTVLVHTKGGAAKGFTKLPDIFEDAENGYMVWNTVFCDGKYVYFSGSAGANDGSFAPSLRIRRADVSALIK